MVYTNKEVGEFINAHYVSVKINGDSLEGKQLREKYQYPGYPTTIIMTSDGEEIDRIVGFDGQKDEYFQLLQDYTAGRGTLGDYLKKLEKEPDNFELNYAVLNKYYDRNDIPMVQKYARIILELDPENTRGKKTEMLYRLAFSEYKTSSEINPMMNFINSCNDELWLEMAYSEVVRYYKKNSDQSQVLTTYESALRRLPQSTSMMNAYAWYIFQNEIAEQYSRGIQIARQAVELEPSADYIWDTLAQLLFAAGQVDEAVQAMQKASELNPQEKSYRELLAKYKQSLNN
ncbi:MAG TPA: tetratricopeptide repeat protein [Candidatus Marinimicrobia bacterium]|nr:tetratricopeptide repeat protein [Candidatus Neomarinimicrobiota bacterium]HRS52126.1 tetratricopeptide repeat protein [Candidatus Neomarinimicrobiota bacterium]HRU92497.1 tetratricopeptide repeat protein [Candidatus Neomarinimicrobiota bacterium]